ncbi:MAG: TonB-dependent receptor [Calditrichia bacterium]
MSNKLNIFFALVFSLLFTGLLWAQDKDKKADQTDYESYKKTASVEVVSSKELSDKTNAEDMSDALKSVPGVFIRDGQINIRDASSNKVLILIDGQRMNSAQSGEFDVTTLPIDAIEKVEVLRGGNSARFGADAVGGVINFITRKGSESSNMNLGIRSTYGSFNSQFYNIYASNQINKFNFYVSYKRTSSDGNFKYQELDGTESTRKDNYSRSNDFMANLGYQVSQNGNLLFTSQFTQTRSGSPGSVPGLLNYGGYPTPGATLKLDNQIYNLSYDQKEIFHNADLSTHAYYHNFNTGYEEPYAFGGPNISDQKSKALGFDATQNLLVNDNLSFTYGYVYRYDKANSTQLGQKSRDTHSAHAAMTLATKKLDFVFDKISVIPAVRYDAPSDFDKVFSPKLSLMLSNSGSYGVNFSAHVSKSYRAPTFNDLYWPDDGYTVGNPNLKPEKGMNYDVGMAFNVPFLRNTQMRFNYFLNNMQDQIIWAPRTSDYKWTPSNVDKSVTSGLESYIGIHPFGEFLNLEVNHTYMDARDASSGLNDGKLLFYRPHNKMDVNMGLKYMRVEFNVNYQWLSKRYVDAANTAYLPSLELWNANIGTNLSAAGLKWMVRLDLNNLADKSYRLSDGYPMPGREIRMTVGMNLR